MVTTNEISKTSLEKTKKRSLDERILKITPTELLHFIHKQVIEVQIARIHETHEDLLLQKETKPVVDFFFTKVYSSNLSEKRFRDDTLDRIFHSIPQYLPENGVQRIRGLIELNELTDKIDILITQKIIEIYHPHLSFVLQVTQYENALKQVDLYKSRVRQVHYIIDTMEFFYNLSRKPFLFLFFGPAKMVARMLDAEILMQITEDGYNAARSLKNFPALAHTLRSREIDYLRSIYGTHRKIPDIHLQKNSSSSKK